MQYIHVNRPMALSPLGRTSPGNRIGSSNKTTKYEDVHDNYCPPAHFFAHTVFGVENGCFVLQIHVSLLMNESIVLILAQTRKGDMNPFHVFVLLLYLRTYMHSDIRSQQNEPARVPGWLASIYILDQFS